MFNEKLKGMKLLFLNLGMQELIIVLPLFVFFIYTLYHAINNKHLTGNQRTLWIIIILATSLLGGLLTGRLERIVVQERDRRGMLG